ncbi:MULTISPECIES: DUF418 domain-containing protein [Paenibacillus]|uniref:DUF418 domain-containing protein n=1 Tax=Paenibacillus TaxID=44249 RepID=UPI001F2E0486|nr:MULTISPECIES: DUF418 domain-containing protein [Paenibacillus]
MTTRKRIRLVDGLRGFSLLGILLANMLIFQYGMFGKDVMHLFHVPAADKAAHNILQVLVEGSFMPIFAFVFGFGMIKMKESLNAKNRKAGWPLVRRFAMLIGLGLLHSTFLWDGDILLFYGAIGFLLLIFMNRKPKTLMVWSIIFLTVAGLIGLAPEDKADKEMQAMNHRIETYVQSTVTLYAEGSYAEIKHDRNTANPLGDNAFILVLALFSPLITAPMFLTGMYAAKKGWFADPDENKSMYRKGALIFIPLGIAMKTFHLLFPAMIGSGSGEMLGGFALSIGYIMGFSLLYTKFAPSPLMERFEAVGKLSLTNYLMQTVICTTLFYGYGFGWFGKLGVIFGCALSLVIYGVQLFASGWYMNRFKSGPVERVLRMWTYFSWDGKAKRKKIVTKTAAAEA